MKVKIRLLSQDEVNRRYSIIQNTIVTEKTNKALSRGDSIVMIEGPGLIYFNLINLVSDIIETLEYQFKGSKITFTEFTDLSQLGQDRAYCAVSIKKPESL